MGLIPFEQREVLQICAVELAGDPDCPDAAVLDQMEVDGSSGQILRSAKGLLAMRRQERPRQFVFLRRLTTQTVRRVERLGEDGQWQ